MGLTVGVLALQGAFLEHIKLLHQAAATIIDAATSDNDTDTDTDPDPDDRRRRGRQQQPKQQQYGESQGFTFTQVRTPRELSRCDALIIPGGESTTISLIAADSGLLEPLRDFVKTLRKPTWGTCAGLILLAESANRTKKGGQELIGGLDVRVNRNHFGRQVESFQADLRLPFLRGIRGAQGRDEAPFPGIFIRAPIVEKVLLPGVEGIQEGEERQHADTVVAPANEAAARETEGKTGKEEVQIMARLPGRVKRGGIAAAAEALSDHAAGDIVAVMQGNVFGTSFHPELTTDSRIHCWFLQKVLDEVGPHVRSVPRESVDVVEMQSCHKRG